MIPVKYKFPTNLAYKPNFYYDVPEEVEHIFHELSPDAQDEYRREKTDKFLPTNLACRPLVGEIIISTNDKFTVTIRKVRHMEQDGHPCLLLDVY